jgi:hypothetical protein
MYEYYTQFFMPGIKSDPSDRRSAYECMMLLNRSWFGHSPQEVLNFSNLKYFTGDLKNLSRFLQKGHLPYSPTFWEDGLYIYACASCPFIRRTGIYIVSSEDCVRGVS